MHAVTDYNSHAKYTMQHACTSFCICIWCNVYTVMWCCYGVLTGNCEWAVWQDGFYLPPPFSRPLSLTLIRDFKSPRTTPLLSVVDVVQSVNDVLSEVSSTLPNHEHLYMFAHTNTELVACCCSQVGRGGSIKYDTFYGSLMRLGSNKPRAIHDKSLSHALRGLGPFKRGAPGLQTAGQG